MKKVLILLLATGFIFSSCSKKSDDDNAPAPGTPGGALSIVAITPTHVTSGGGNDGTATAIVGGGVAPYSYAWSTTPVQITATATGLSAGTYTVIVADAAGTIAQASVTITQPNTIGPVPSTFTQKVLVEEFTGAWCQFCPDGALILEQIIAAYLGQAIGASIHSGDGMEISLMTALDNEYNVSGFPTGMVSRKTFSGTSPVMSRSAWDNACWGEINKDGGCGLAIKTTAKAGNPNAFDIEVHAGFNKDLSAKDLRLTIYVMEDKVTGYPQTSAYNNDPSSPFYQQGNPIVNYEHNHTVRKVLTADLGDAIPSSKAKPGQEFIFTGSFGASNYDKSNVHIVAFVHETDANTTKHEILNVQEAKLGELKSWD